MGRYDITGLEAGTAIYARVSAHTLMSYGYSALSDPEFAIPSNVQPGAPPAVRLWASSESFITVRWDHPTVDGGKKVRHIQVLRIEPRFISKPQPRLTLEQMIMSIWQLVPLNRGRNCRLRAMDGGMGDF